MWSTTASPNSASTDGSCSFGQVVRAGGNVHDTMPRLDLHDFRQVRTCCPGIRRALDACLGERRNQLAHVHVHAATVARPRLGEGRRVE